MSPCICSNGLSRIGGRIFVIVVVVSALVVDVVAVGDVGCR